METTPSSWRDRKKLQTWREIRRVALALIAERGFENVSVDEIAEVASVSRTTFFNYFAAKEGVVFDPDPDDAARWRAMIDERAADEPIWQSLSAVFLGYADLIGDRLGAQKQLKSRSPALSSSARDSSDQFLADVRAWLDRRRVDPATMQHCGGSERTVKIMLLHLAVAAAATAYEAWNPERPFGEYREILRWALDRADPA